jgi:hypothetical protein
MPVVIDKVEVHIDSNTQPSKNANRLAVEMGSMARARVIADTHKTEIVVFGEPLYRIGDSIEPYEQ